MVILWKILNYILVAFSGTEADDLKSKLYKELEILITNKKVCIFLFGSKSQFDNLCHKTVSQLKDIYPHIKRIYVRAEFRHTDDSYKEYLLKNFENTYYPSKIIGSGKSAYIQRNYEMIHNSSYCICYYDENYSPQRQRNSRQHSTDGQLKSGTSIAVACAKNHGLNIINLN